MFVYIYIHTYMHTYIHAYIHTHTRMDMNALMHAWIDGWMDVDVIFVWSAYQQTWLLKNMSQPITVKYSKDRKD